MDNPPASPSTERAPRDTPALPAANLPDRTITTNLWSGTTWRLQRRAAPLPLAYSKSGSQARFSAADGPRVVYLGLHPDVCFAELLGPSFFAPAPGGRAVDAARFWGSAENQAPGRLLLRIELKDVTLIDLTSPVVLSEISADATVFGATYTVTHRWAAALAAHPCRPDGLLYGSRFRPGRPCLALFEHQERLPGFSVSATEVDAKEAERLFLEFLRLPEVGGVLLPPAPA